VRTLWISSSSFETEKTKQTRVFAIGACHYTLRGYIEHFHLVREDIEQNRETNWLIDVNGMVLKPDLSQSENVWLHINLLRTEFLVNKASLFNCLTKLEQILRTFDVSDESFAAFPTMYLRKECQDEVPNHLVHKDLEPLPNDIPYD
jgi:hypothetical protein